MWKGIRYKILVCTTQFPKMKKIDGAIIQHFRNKQKSFCQKSPTTVKTPNAPKKSMNGLVRKLQKYVCKSEFNISIAKLRESAV